MPLPDDFDDEAYAEIFNKVQADVSLMWEQRWCDLAKSDGKSPGYARSAMMSALVGRAASEWHFCKKLNPDDPDGAREQFLRFCGKTWDFYEAAAKCAQ